jgi:hypothetical protein
MMVPMAMHRAELPSNQELEEVGWNRVWACDPQSQHWILL